MEDAPTCGQARRTNLRPPRKKTEHHSPNEASGELPTETSTSTPPEGITNTGPKPQKKRRNKKKPTAENGGASTAPAESAAASSSQGADALTWQQESILSVSASEFRPATATTTATSAGAAPDAVHEKKNRRKRTKKPPKTAQTENAAEGQTTSAPEEFPQCLLCCSPMLLVSFGSCGHRAACGACCLRLRCCYGRTDCPLCKTELKSVVIAPLRPDLPEFLHFIHHPEGVAKSRPGELGPGSVLVDRWQGGRRPPSSRLLHDLIRSTKFACSVCDAEGRQPFARPGQLESHLRERHGLFLCGEF